MIRLGPSSMLVDVTCHHTVRSVPAHVNLHRTYSYGSPQSRLPAQDVYRTASYR